MSIEAKVAMVISSREVVLNAGADKEVQVGSIATVYEVFEVPDPEAGDESSLLGTLRRQRIRLRVTEVLDNMCIAETYRTVRKRPVQLDLFASFEPDPVQRVTPREADADYRTVHLSRGEPVRISPPKKDKDSTEANDSAD